MGRGRRKRRARLAKAARRTKVQCRASQQEPLHHRRSRTGCPAQARRQGALHRACSRTGCLGRAAMVLQTALPAWRCALQHCRAA